MLCSSNAQNVVYAEYGDCIIQSILYLTLNRAESWLRAILHSKKKNLALQNWCNSKYSFVAEWNDSCMELFRHCTELMNQRKWYFEGLIFAFPWNLSSDTSLIEHELVLIVIFWIYWKLKLPSIIWYYRYTLYGYYNDFLWRVLWIES